MRVNILLRCLVSVRGLRLIKRISFRCPVRMLLNCVVASVNWCVRARLTCRIINGVTRVGSKLRSALGKLNRVRRLVSVILSIYVRLNLLLSIVFRSMSTIIRGVRRILRSSVLNVWPKL